ncbi:DNA recombination protein RmuC [Photobacterium damselae subsp. piscicida]|uniref:DNA recombination protein RmuC n=1 Tax=Photobacterium damsela subsp. piscicida TaxID=38294 RepID=A0A1V1V718_PHODP|nr:DNA recombination protein RmuC [Photobacterium damselae]MBE8128011.1 DNA recombination protein RmuC [Photobacterium damselae subsp. piscicida]PSV80190.1 DNA recombination protein RmuC [Photobacterium damselae]PSW84847.1 DNA recombination protein RmuC [Photobacterium damselae]QOD52736.1 DNA recombination protein RmuC [Photobacterium damselae subsp. piscicida]QOD56584.1 DNA recombination protein RmuC [Photobacterium damselae subsp. piscicida]
MTEWLSGGGLATLAALSGATIASIITAMWLRGRYEQELALVEQQADNELKLSQAREAQLQQQLQQSNEELDEMDVERDRLTAELRQMHGRLAAAVEKMRYFEALKIEKQYVTEQLENARAANANLEADLREQYARHFEEQKAAEEKIKLLENAEERLRIQFESLANRLFEQKSRSVDEQNRISLEGLLMPLKEQLEGFKKQVNDSFSYEARERHTLIHQINSLKQLNEQMAKEAVNLTQALKGDNKAQGNWGEVILARVLSESGLREGHEYQTQVSLENDEGKRYQPDVVVRLPENKDVVIDAKMSLVAYERFYHAELAAERELALSEHVASVRGHMRGLSRKDYHQLHGVRSLDYVLMFIPVEPAFQAAIEADSALIRDAMDLNIMLVSPTTLLVALRTINNLWRNERQNQNAKEIAERASRLYDKLRLFVTDMEAMGASLEKANQSYQGAMNKLVSGRGNVLRQAESFKQLGVEVKRDINPQLTEKAMFEGGLAEQVDALTHQDDK